MTPSEKETAVIKLMERMNINVEIKYIENLLENMDKVGVVTSSLQISYELLLRRLKELEDIDKIASVWLGFSDRRKYPTASYDLSLGTTNLDLLVHLDTLLFHPKGHMFMKNSFGYSEGQILLLNRKTGTAAKFIIEDRVRS